MQIPKPWFRTSHQAWFVQWKGKQVYLSRDKAKAVAKWKKMLRRNKAPSTLTVRAVLDLYWKWLKSNRAEETASSREKLLKSFGESVAKNMRAEDLKPHHVSHWVESNEKIKSPSTANSRITLIMGAFSWAKRMGHLDENPLAGMPKPTPRVRQEFVPAVTWSRVLELATDQEFRDWLTVLLATGCRVTEMFKFTAANCDGEKFTLLIEDSKGRRKSRVVWLPEEVKPIIKRLMAANPEGPLFLNRKGRPWNRNSIRCRFRRLKRELKMPTLTATTLRHSFAHHRLTSGQDSLTVSKLMGHTDGRMLATRYGHIEANPEYMRNAINQTGFPALPSTPPTPTA